MIPLVEFLNLEGVLNDARAIFDAGRGKTATVAQLVSSILRHYNPDKAPRVDHFTGTDLVIAHVEKYWCPTFTSSDLTSEPPFRFAEDKR